MTLSTQSNEAKVGFWQRLGLFLEAIDKTEADYQWDAIRSVHQENDKLRARIAELENSGNCAPAH